MFKTAVDTLLTDYGVPILGLVGFVLIIGVAAAIIGAVVSILLDIIFKIRQD